LSSKKLEVRRESRRPKNMVCWRVQ